MVGITFDKPDNSPIDVATSSGWGALVEWMELVHKKNPTKYHELGWMVNDNVIVDVIDLIRQIEFAMKDHPPEDEEVEGVIDELLNILYVNHKSKNAFVVHQGY